MILWRGGPILRNCSSHDLVTCSHSAAPFDDHIDALDPSCTSLAISSGRTRLGCKSKLRHMIYYYHLFVLHLFVPYTGKHTALQIQMLLFLFQANMADPPETWRVPDQTGHVWTPKMLRPPTVVFEQQCCLQSTLVGFQAMHPQTGNCKFVKCYR